MAAAAEVVKCVNVEDVYRCISDHEERYRVKFITAHKDKDFGKNNECVPDPGKFFLRWRLDYGGQSPKIGCDGVPFFYMHRHVLICHQGRDRNEKTKAKRKALVQFSNASNQEQTQKKKKRKLVQDTKKVDCPASVYVVQILRFIDHKVQFQGQEPTGHSKVLAKRHLREEYKNDSSSIRTQTLFYVSLPSLSSHVGHPVNNIAAGLREALDPRILQKIAELTAKGICKVPDVRKHLDEYVQSALFHSSEQPERTRRRYYPTDSDIRNAVQKAKKEVHTKVDQKNAAMLVSLWRQENKDFFEFRPLQPGSEPDKFLFCCQTRWQSRLLNKYGNSLTVLDAVYRNVGYSLPLFLLSVRTNMGYTVVGMFISHSDAMEDIAEALRVFRRWNPDWNPDGFIVDYFDPEIEATEMVFPGCTALFSYHRCETLWQEWLRDSSGISDGLTRARIIKILRRIAIATTMREHECGLKGLKTMSIWKGKEEVFNWFNTFWLSCMKRWTSVYQNERVRVDLYAANGLKKQLEMFNQGYVSDNKDCSLSEIITILYTKCFPEEYRKYVEFNARYSSGYLKYSSDVPAFLHSKPRFIVEHVEKTMKTPIIPHIIQGEENGRFIVNQIHQVFFGNEEVYPSCSCSYWTRLYLPCKHFCAIFQHVPGWSWDQLGASYKDNPLFLLDGDVLQDNASRQYHQEDQQHNAENVGTMVSGGDTGEESSKVPAETAKRPQRAAVTCKHLVRKNMDLLDKLELQVPQLKDKSFLEEMLKTLQGLAHRVQGIRSQGRMNAAKTHRTSCRIKNRRKSSSRTKVHGDPKRNTEKGDVSQVCSELSKGAHTLVGNNALSHNSQVDNSPAGNDVISINQSVAEGGQKTSGSGQESANHVTDILQLHVNSQVESRASDNIPGEGEIRHDVIEAIVLQQNPYTYLPFNVEDSQGTHGTSEEQHPDLQRNITFVTEDPVLEHEVLTTDGIVIQTVDQVDQESFIIDSTHQGVTVTITNTDLDPVPSVT